MTIYLERYNGERWVAVLAAPNLLSITDVYGPANSYPPAEGANHVSALAGALGWRARIRRDDEILEEFEWDKVAVNPLDQDSDMKWGWKSVYRNYLPPPATEVDAGPWGFLG